MLNCKRLLILLPAHERILTIMFHGHRKLCRQLALRCGSTIAIVLVCAVSLGDEPENRQILESLPLDRRASLAEKLERFDGMTSADRQAIRRLDAQIALLEPVDRSRLQSLLHRYHLWVLQLSLDQKQALLEAKSPQKRLQLILDYQKAQTAQRTKTGPRLAGIRLGDFGLIGPFDCASLIKTWRALPANRQKELARMPRSQLYQNLRDLAKQMDLASPSLPNDREVAYDARLESDEEFKPLVDPLRRANTSSKVDPQASKDDSLQKRFENPFAQFLYFEDNPPTEVDPANLERFVSDAPDWFQTLIDSLSADDARAYVSTVYRLLYPHPGEMPETPKDRPAVKTTPKKADGKTPGESSPPAF